MADATAPQKPAPAAPVTAPAPAPAAAAPGPDTVTTGTGAALNDAALWAIGDAVKRALDDHHAATIRDLEPMLGTGLSAIDPAATREEMEAAIRGAVAEAVKAGKRTIGAGPAWMKWIAGAALLGSVFALVLTKQVEATVYLGMVMTALGGLGYHAATQQAAPKGDVS